MLFNLSRHSAATRRAGCCHKHLDKNQAESKQTDLPSTACICAPIHLCQLHVVRFWGYEWHCSSCHPVKSISREIGYEAIPSADSNAFHCIYGLYVICCNLRILAYLLRMARNVVYEQIDEPLIATQPPAYA